MNKELEINKIKRRADTLAEFFIERYERLEKENRKLLELHNQNYLKLHTHELAFKKVLDDIIKIEKDNNNTIFITFKGKDNNGDTDLLYTYFTQDEPMYPLAEMLLEKYEKEAEFERLLRKGIKANFTPTTPLTKGE